MSQNTLFESTQDEMEMFQYKARNFFFFIFIKQRKAAINMFVHVQLSGFFVICAIENEQVTNLAFALHDLLEHTMQADNSADQNNWHIRSCPIIM